jgi:hypothetical protein
MRLTRSDKLGHLKVIDFFKMVRDDPGLSTGNFTEIFHFPFVKSRETKHRNSSHLEKTIISIDMFRPIRSLKKDSV